MSVPIYHLAPAERWHTWDAERPYLPAEFDTDGFIHCTGEADVMLKVANRFYRTVPGAFVLLEIDPDALDAPLRWEPPADPLPNSQPLAESFPHIYGPLNQNAVVAVHDVRRAADGTFEGW